MLTPSKFIVKKFICSIIISVKKFSSLIFILVALFYVQSCKYDKIGITDEGGGTAGFPEAIGKIYVSRCAVTGCHTTNDNQLAGGLNLTSWNTLFQGARNGSPVVPFNSKYSFLCYFINSYPDLGITNATIGNTMPPAPAVALSHDDVVTVENWINDGARDQNGNLRFPDSPDRKKIYIANSGCDEVAVIDAESRQIMRYVSVGHDASVNEQPHQIRISPDGNFWYVVFRNGQFLQKYSTLDDSFVSEVNIGFGAWNSVAISPDGNHAFITDFNPSPQGKLAHVNLQTMSVNYYSPMDSPHGAYFMRTQNVLYVTAQYGNFIYKFDFSADPNYNFLDNPAIITMRPGALVTTSSSFDPHEVMFTPDESRYFVTCQSTNEVRVFNFNIANDTLVDSIAVGGFPQEMIISPSRHYLLITCQEDSASSEVQAGLEKGSVFVYDYQAGHLLPVNNTSTLGITRVYQPHGIAVDEVSGLAFVASLNYSTTGPAPHHPGGCGGRNGFMTAIDLNTLEYVNFFVPDLQFTYLYKSELLSFPYSVMAK